MPTKEDVPVQQPAEMRLNKEHARTTQPQTPEAQNPQLSSTTYFEVMQELVERFFGNPSKIQPGSKQHQNPVEGHPVQDNLAQENLDPKLDPIELERATYDTSSPVNGFARAVLFLANLQQELINHLKELSVKSFLPQRLHFLFELPEKEFNLKKSADVYEAYYKEHPEKVDSILTAKEQLVQDIKKWANNYANAVNKFNVTLKVFFPGIEEDRVKEIITNYSESIAENNAKKEPIDLLEHTTKFVRNCFEKQLLPSFSSEMTKHEAAIVEREIVKRLLLIGQCCEKLEQLGNSKILNSEEIDRLIAAETNLPSKSPSEFKNELRSISGENSGENEAVKEEPKTTSARISRR